MALSCSPASSNPSVGAHLAHLVVGHPLLRATKGLGLLLVDALARCTGALQAGTVGLCKDVVSLDARTESARAWDRLALLLASHGLFLSEEDLRCLVEALRSRATLGGNLFVVIESVGSLLEGLVADQRVTLVGGVHSIELVKFGGRN